MIKLLTILYSIWMLSFTYANIQHVYPRTFELERAKCEDDSGKKEIDMKSFCGISKQMYNSI